LSVLNSINRILESTKTIDPTTCLVAKDKNGHEIVYTGQLQLPPSKDEATAYINQFVQEPRMSARNELIGLITLKSNTNFRAIKKSHAVQQGLNEFPKIFLTPNYLSVVTPVLVGFFVNQYPRPDMPETFQDRTNDFIRTHDQDIQYQLDYGPIWAKNRKMSVFKLMTSLANKEHLRTLMEQYHNEQDDTEYICAAEFYSLSDEGKITIIMNQVDFCTKTKSIFIQGFKNIDVQLRIEATEDDADGKQTLANWLHKRTTTYGQQMFSRIYKPKNGTIELYTPIANHKEALDWARLSTSDIAKELNDKSMEEIFINPKDAYDKLAVQPDWKPHTLAKRIENLVMPETIKNQGRRKIVAMSYDQENTQGEKQQRNTINQVWNDKAKSREGTKDNTITPEEPKGDTANNTNLPKFGANKYKVAAAAQDKRMQKIEENLEIMIQLQKRSQAEIQADINCVKEHQNVTKEILTTLGEEVSNNFKQIQKNKKDTDDTLKKFRAALALLDQAMDKPASKESPRRKIRRPTLPPEDVNMQGNEDSDDASYGSVNSFNSNKAPRSDDEMTVAAGGN
jgi:hypothetical protein